MCLTVFQLGRYQALAGLEDWPEIPFYVGPHSLKTIQFFDEWIAGWHSLDKADFDRLFPETVTKSD